MQGNNTKKSSSTHISQWTGLKGKTLWDWLQVLIIPIALAGGAFYIDAATGFLTADQQRETLLNEYFTDMTGLLLEHNLRQAEEGSEVRTIARVRTLTTLRRMDGARKGFIMVFLSESKLISRDDPIVSLSGANLRDANLSGVDLRNADLQNVYLFQAKFDETNLKGANLSGAVLTQATVRKTNLMEAYLCNTYFPDQSEQNRDCPIKTPIID